MSTASKKTKISSQISVKDNYFVSIFKALSDQICFRIFNLLRTHDYLSLQEIAVILKTPELLIIRRLSKLEVYDLVKRSGTSCQTLYLLNKNNKNVFSLVNIIE